MREIKNKSLYLQRAWNKRLKLRTNGDKFYTEANKLRTETKNRRAVGLKLLAEISAFETDKCYIDGDKYYLEGDIVWAKAVFRCYGNVEMIWNYSNKVCIVGGVVYKW